MASRTDMTSYGQYSQTRDANNRMTEALTPGRDGRIDYSEAADICTGQIDRYRQMGDERTALAYEVALIDIHGLRRNQFFDPNWYNSASPDDRARAESNARDRILQDVGAAPARYEEDGKPTYGAIVGTPSSLSIRTRDGIHDLASAGDRKQAEGARRMGESL